MFTGIITDVGDILSIKPTAQGQLHRLRIGCAYDQTTIADGASIACNGVCLTVVLADPTGVHMDISPETIRVSALGTLKRGAAVNLERPMRADARMVTCWPGGRASSRMPTGSHTGLGLLLTSNRGPAVPGRAPHPASASAASAAAASAATILRRLMTRSPPPAVP